jgi:hypothetical protein
MDSRGIQHRGAADRVSPNPKLQIEVDPPRSALTVLSPLRDALRSGTYVLFDAPTLL